MNADHAKIERSIASKIVRAAIKEGWAVSINDGEEWCLVKSRKYREIMEALASTDSDQLKFRNSESEVMGNLWLIWGNGEDCVHDYSTALDDFMQPLI